MKHTITITYDDTGSQIRDLEVLLDGETSKANEHYYRINRIFLGLLHGFIIEAEKNQKINEDMKKEITITAADVLQEEYTRQEMHAIASAMIDKLYNTPEVKNEISIETKEAKPFCVIETDTAILLPFIDKKIPYDLYKEACDKGYMKWDKAEDWCKERNACQFTIDELCVVRYFVKEIDEIFKRHGLTEFSKLLGGRVWSSSQYNYYYSWICSSSSVNNYIKSLSNSVVPACAL